MAEHFLIETTNESGVVEQERVSVKQTELDWRNRSLVRIVGPLERATALRQLVVHRQSTHFWCRISRILVFVQLHDNCLFDVPACVLASTQLEYLSVSVVSSFCFFVVGADSSAALP
jgi:hypothetical protein